MSTLRIVRADGQDDGVVVFCLSPGRQGDLIDAAVSLGLAQRSTNPMKPIVVGTSAGLSASEWRATHSKDFDRACTALVRAKGPAALQSSPGLLDSTGSVVLPLVPVLAGAALTAAVSHWLDARTRGRQAADALTATISAFTEAMRRLIEGRSSNKSEVAQKLSDARAAAQRLIARGTHYRTAQRLAHQLTSAPLDDEAVDGWLSRDPRAQAKVRPMTARLAEVEATTDLLALALSTPGRPHVSLWFAGRGHRS